MINLFPFTHVRIHINIKTLSFSHIHTHINLHTMHSNREKAIFTTYEYYNELDLGH